MNCVYLMASSGSSRLIWATVVKTDRHPIRMDPEEQRGERFNDSLTFKKISMSLARAHTHTHLKATHQLLP